jgi:hypothetical protein
LQRFAPLRQPSGSRLQSLATARTNEGGGMAIATSDIGHSRSDHVRVVLRVANGYLAVSSRDCPAKCGAFLFFVSTRRFAAASTSIVRRFAGKSEYG